MKNNYHYKLIENQTQAVVFNGDNIVTNYSKLPKRLIEIIAEKFGLTLYSEINYHTDKIMYKVGIKSDDNGGFINIFTTESHAKLNRFICNYRKVTQ